MQEFLQLDQGIMTVVDQRLTYFGDMVMSASLIESSQMMIRPRGELRRQQFDIGVVLVRDHLREAVTVLEHLVVAAMEVTDLDSVSVEVPTKVAVLETALGLVQLEVLEDSCCQDLAGGVALNMPGMVGTIPSLASRALLDAITVDSLDIFERIARCSFRIERPQFIDSRDRYAR
ncbi:hypothetical protein L3X38_041847 [Prunus dulcis]|uniref:Uncharacterized protein n=1 Tax=Prunus dulcis TaxID=3755 RepID=A0AAD4UUT0_PRUDU|nr:hypothetical protein L3X38_041847 [Prunus dulcis]